MDKYKKITDLGLKVCNKSTTWIIPQSFVSADDLLKVLDAGVEVTGMHNSVWDFSEMDSDSHKYQAIVIGIKELKPKQVTITRADLDKAFECNEMSVSVDLLAKRLGL